MSVYLFDGAPPPTVSTDLVTVAGYEITETSTVDLNNDVIIVEIA